MINDPSGAAPISIDVFTTDAGGTPNAVDDVTVVASGLVYFDRTINPASATVTSTLWKMAPMLTWSRAPSRPSCCGSQVTKTQA